LDLHLLDRVLYGATVTQWLIAIATFGGVYVILSLARRLIERRLGALAARTTTHVDDVAVEVLRRTRPFFLVVIALQAAMRVITPDGRVAAVLHGITVVAVLIQVGIWGNGLIGFGAERYAQRRGDEDIGARATIRAVGYAGRFLLWVLLLITALDNFGVEITGLITGLGIGGIAIALAVQNILGDLFAALAIVLDKPFVVGEFIIVDNVMGTVEHVGLKTTRLRSLGGEQIIVSNADLLKSRIRNYKRMQERRIVFSLDVTYDTPPDKVARIPAIVREAVEAQPITRFERSHFLHWMDSSLRIETVYWVLDPDYAKYADTQQAVNLELLRRFSSEGVAFAFPSRTLHVQYPGDSPERRDRTPHPELT
jgi:small-conductance mechanosensitive channel